LRRGHGKGAGSQHIEVLPFDEQPIGVPAPTKQTQSAEAGRLGRANGRIADRSLASELGRRGGLARAAKACQLRALTGLGLRGATPEALRPYLEDANQFAESEVERLARECGGGVCPQNAAALVQQAALAMAGSRAAYAEGDAAAGAKLGVEVRQNLLGARELTVLEAKSRPKGKNSVLAAIEAKAGGAST
ncbi:MAG TPA: hypothetical protein VJV79_36505, partial [Polyangiaceae bacterium]|nr:hypothetical protein [Polyangiaceae bacterium]